MTAEYDTVGQRLYPVPNLYDVALRNLADRMLMVGIPERMVIDMRVADLVSLVRAAADAEPDS